ncbi:metallophosphoesterase [Rathayibacter sp. AY1D5]|uniref:metallophosphoesterase n=1 Tax=Rathayibacter sp. AY1D5 TaxID=2080546 RepID=UPI000CE8156B|nr:metallophosphoesterase [Rathayibacter sp. AY1D5]PPH89828.1 hypothetical protein C5C82_07165 [Rathayibacter sp. AY1D5]
MPEYTTFDFDQIDFVTSDTHFSHARISELTGRPFSTVAEMDAELIRRWNDTVAPESVVLHLGDLALGRIAESLPITAQLHGRRFLVPGNHDRVSPATQSNHAVERFTPLYLAAGWEILPEVITGTRAGHRVIKSHYPYSGDTQDEDRHSSHRPIDRGLPLLHGHTHARENGPVGYQFHVGVDAFELAPVPMSLVDEWLDDLRRRESLQQDIAVVKDALQATWIDSVTDRWLESSNAFLDGARPIDVLRANDLTAVMEAVGQEVGGGYR